MFNLKVNSNFTFNLETLQSFQKIVPIRQRSGVIESLVSQFISENKKGGSVSITATDSKIVSSSSSTKKGDIEWVSFLKI